MRFETRFVLTIFSRQAFQPLSRKVYANSQSPEKGKS